MDYSTLAAEIAVDPLARGYAGMTDVQVAESLGTADRTEVAGRRVDERAILGEFATPAAGEAFLQKLEVIAGSDDLVARVLRWMRPSEEGVDVGHPATREMLDSLVGSAGVTAEEVAAVKAMAERPISRSEELKLGYVASRHVGRARGSG
jgi:hypothetical protein